MTEPTAISITPTLSIPSTELSFRATRSGGPGGQHVNTSSTRIELWWDAATSPSLTAAQREQVRARLSTRLTADGLLRIVASETRSQKQNRELAIERFQEVLARALATPKKRKATRPSRAAKERRITEKKQRGARKRERRSPRGEE
ncbi:MAG: alternative ribosome rescue aminoacyl-tRNA hydrolase ArfB [Gemmatimonadota bacterium]